LYKEIEAGIFQIAINIDGEWWIDDSIIQWMYDLKNNGSKYNSRRTYANALNIFLHFYIYKPQVKLESLYDYMLRFRNELRSGLLIKTKRDIKTKRMHINVDYTVLTKKPLRIKTVNTYMTAVQWYLTFLKEKKKDENIQSLYSEDVDWNLLKKKSIHGKGGGYGLMMNPLLAQLLGPRKKLIKNLSTKRGSDDLESYFPPELFLNLLSISNPREQAIYLLCGCAGTRIGQALSLTRDDYSYEMREVYIVDPYSDEKGASGKEGRFSIMKRYNIDLEKNPYKYVSCKYPIPLQYAPLLWISPTYKDRFFKVLAKVNKGNPIVNGHPFIFHTSSGKILTPSECYRTFKSKVNILLDMAYTEWKEKNINLSFKEKQVLDKNYQYLINQLQKVKGLHSLRHMYGVMWADYTTNETYHISMEQAQTLCQFGLGHKSQESVFNYFTLRQKTRNSMVENLLCSMSTQEKMADYLKSYTSYTNFYFKRKI